MSATKVSLPTNTMAFAAVSLILTGIFAFGTWLTTDFTAPLRKTASILAAILLGVTGHLFQSVFGHFSVVYFLTLFNFLQNVVFAQFSGDIQVRVLQTAAVVPAAFNTDDLQSRGNLAKQASMFMFWITLGYVSVYGTFVYVPAIQKYIPSALAAERNVY